MTFISVIQQHANAILQKDTVLYRIQMAIYAPYLHIMHGSVSFLLLIQERCPYIISNASTNILDTKSRATFQVRIVRSVFYFDILCASITGNDRNDYRYVLCHANFKCKIQITVVISHGNNKGTKVGIHGENKVKF